MDVYEFLDRNRIKFERHDHPPVFTCEQARELVKIDGGADTKNLFLRDKKGTRHFLVVVGYEKALDLAKLSELVGVSRLQMASSECLNEVLSIEPGSVSLLALVNDRDNRVELIIDKTIWSADCVRCHPLVNTTTLLIPQNDLRQFLELTGHDVTVLRVPAK